MTSSKLFQATLIDYILEKETDIVFREEAMKYHWGTLERAVIKYHEDYYEVYVYEDINGTLQFCGDKHPPVGQNEIFLRQVVPYEAVEVRYRDA